QDKTHFEALREKFEFVLQERNPISLSNIPDLESPISYNCISFDRHNRAGHSIIGKTKSGISRATPNLSRNLLLFRFKSEVNSDQTLRDSFKKQYQDLRNRVDDSFFIDHNSTTDSKLVSEVPKDNVGGFYSDA